MTISDNTSPTNPRLITPTDVAKLIRAELRAAFPGAKFSVRCQTGTASAWINVHWTDGPTVSQVQGIACMFEGRSFNGTTDTYDDHGDTLLARDNGQMPETIRYCCDGVNVTRELSPAAALEAQRVIRTNSTIPDITICDAEGTLIPGTLIGPDCEGTVVIGGEPVNFPWLDAHLAVWHVMGPRDLTPTRTT